MTVQRQSQLLDLQSDHQKMRQLFQRFSEATGDAKRAIAQEIRDLLVAAPPGD